MSVDDVLDLVFVVGELVGLVVCDAYILACFACCINEEKKGALQKLDRFDSSRCSVSCLHLSYLEWGLMSVQYRCAIPGEQFGDCIFSAS